MAQKAVQLIKSASPSSTNIARAEFNIGESLPKPCWPDGDPSGLKYLANADGPDLGQDA